MRLQRTESLLAIVRTLRSQFVGESQDALDEFVANFDPHISLAYGDGFSDNPESLKTLKETIEKFASSLKLSAFQFIVLMDTRANPSKAPQEVVSDWKASPIRLAM